MASMNSNNDSYSTSSRKSTVDVPSTSLLDHSSTTSIPPTPVTISQRSVSTSSATMMTAKIVQSPQRMAESIHETIFLSSAGDVLVCRKQPHAMENSHASNNTLAKLDATQCLDTICVNGTTATHSSAKPSRRSRAAVIVDEEDTMSTQLQTKSSLCSPWSRGAGGGSGLLGGAADAGEGGEDDGIALIQSFDYSQFHEANEVPPATTTAMMMDDDPSDDASKSTIFPNIPCFHPGFSSVPIATVSASRSHVLLIARDSGLLYAYGSNSFGQLGVGGTTQGVATPTIVTALAQGGGKVVACAAGTTHSLATVVRRRQPPKGSGRNRKQQQSTSYYSYQVYGWGQTNVLGLLNPNKNQGAVATVLPRRVAKLQGPHPFLLQARSSRSAAATAIVVGGSIYTWGIGDQPVDHGGPPPSSAIQQLALTDIRVYSRTVSGECWTCCFAQNNSSCYEWQRLSLDVQRIHSSSLSNVVTCCTSATGDVYRWNDAAAAVAPASSEAAIIAECNGGNSSQPASMAAGTVPVPPPQPLCILQNPRHNIVDVCGDWCVAHDGQVLQHSTAADEGEEPLQPAYGGLRLWWSAVVEA